MMIGSYVCVTCIVTGEKIMLPVDRERSSGPGELGADTVTPFAFAQWITSLVVGNAPRDDERWWDAEHRSECFVPRTLPPGLLPESAVAMDPVENDAGPHGPSDCGGLTPTRLVSEHKAWVQRRLRSRRSPRPTMTRMPSTY
jgi:hypothetical protein